MYILSIELYSIAPDVYTIPLPLNARADVVQISWMQVNSSANNTGVWQLDNIAILYASEMKTLSSPVLFYSGGTIEVRKIRNKFTVILNHVLTMSEEYNA